VNTAIDSSVIIAIIRREPTGDGWMNRLIRARESGGLLACEAVWAETRQLYSSREAHAQAMNEFGLQFSPMLATAAALAGEIQKAYRQAGGKRDRLLADFLVGAHALVQADQLATCDSGFLRPYFRQLKILEV
jgi:predicted nucleic acid-binding protein